MGETLSSASPGSWSTFRHAASAFRRFVPVDVMRQLLANGSTLEPSGEPREITAMFTDVKGFTRIAETTPPGILVEQLTQYFNAASVVIARHGGTIDKFIGDGIMVLWGARGGWTPSTPASASTPAPW